MAAIGAVISRERKSEFVRLLCSATKILLRHQGLMTMLSDTFASAVRSTTRTAARASLAVTLAAAGLVGATGLASAATITPAAAAASAVVGHTLYTAPTGSGKACTTAAPCSLVTAVNLSQAGDSILLGAGNYGVVEINRGGATVANPVTVQPAPGATVTFDRLSTYSPNLIWKNFQVNLTFYIYSSATGTVVDNILIDGGGMFVRSKNVVVRNSEFRNGSSIDGLQISGADGVLIENNYIHDYNQDKGGSSGFHADCIQLYDASNVTIRENSMRNCYNTGMIFSNGANKGIYNVLVESNFIQGCLVKSTKCAGDTTVDARYTKMGNVVIRNNTLLNGSTRITAAGATFDRNIIGYLSDCSAVMSNSIVSSWNTGLCKIPSAIGSNGNRIGSVSVVDPTTGDLRLVDANDATVTNVGSSKAAATDRFGSLLPQNIAGANTPSASAVAAALADNSKNSSQTSGGKTATAAAGSVDGGTTVKADTTKPTVSITSPKTGSKLAGTVTATFAAADNVGVTKVQVLGNGIVLGNAVKSGTGWALTVDTAKLPKGTWNVQARAWDAANNFGDSAKISITLG
jgi:hypothetical protein